MSWIADADRETYRRLADALLPAHGKMPSASAVGVDKRLDEILGWRPDLAADLMRGLRKAREADAEIALKALESEDPEAFAALKLAALGAYYIHPDVMGAMEYPGQQSHTPFDDETADYRNPDLLDSVRNRGPIWRKAPA